MTAPASGKRRAHPVGYRPLRSGQFGFAGATLMSVPVDADVPQWSPDIVGPAGGSGFT